MKADIDAAFKEAWLVQLGRLFEEMKEWPPVEGYAAAGIGVGLSDINRARLPAAYREASVALRRCEKIDEANEWASKAAAIAAYARIAKDQQLLAIRSACPAEGKSAAVGFA